MSARRSSERALGFLLLALVGCDEGAQGRAGLLDPDGGAMALRDASQLDATPDPVRDAAPDAALDGERPSMRTDCDNDELTFPLPDAEGRLFDLAVEGTTVHLSYLEVGCQGIGLRGDPRALRYARFGTSGPPLEERELVACRSVRWPVMLRDAYGLQTFVTGTGDQGYALSAIDVRDGAAFTLASLPNLDGELAGTQRGGTSLLAFVARPSGQATSLYTLLEEARHELSSTSAARAPAGLALAAWPGEEDVGGVVGWVERDAARQGIHLQAFDATGAASGEPRVLTQALGTRSAIAASALAEGGGAVIYTEASAADTHVLQLRSLDERGVPGDARSLTGSTEDAAHPAITAYGGGYVIAYRRLGSELNRAASIQLAFVDGSGNTSGTRLVAPTTLSGATVAVELAQDGRLVVAWDALDEVGVDDAGLARIERRLHVARLTCL